MRFLLIEFDLPCLQLGGWWAVMSQKLYFPKDTFAAKKENKLWAENFLQNFWLFLLSNVKIYVINLKKVFEFEVIL